MAEEGAAWLTWQEAADLVGCPVATIDWHKRQGRILSRGQRRASLERASVEAFGTWWRERERRRAERRAARLEAGKGHLPPGPHGWLSTGQAGELLGITASEVVYRIDVGHLTGQQAPSTGRWWVPEAEVRALVAEDARWMTQAEAAALAGVAPGTVHAAVVRGDIVRRERPRRWASLERTSVEAWVERRAAREAQRNRDRAPRSGPPQYGGVWLDTATAAVLFGVRREQVRQLIASERLPATRVGRCWWVRREDAERVAAERARVAAFYRTRP